MKITANDVKRNAIKAVFVIIAVAIGFAISTNLELPTETQAELNLTQNAPVVILVA